MHWYKRILKSCNLISGAYLQTLDITHKELKQHLRSAIEHNTLMENGFWI